MRYCVVCGKEFENNSKENYCSNECIEKEFGNKVKNTCWFCGKEITNIENYTFTRHGSNGLSYSKCHITCEYRTLNYNLKQKEAEFKSYKEYIDKITDEINEIKEALKQYKEKHKEKLIAENL